MESTELWRQCAEWFLRHSLIQHDHNVLKSGATYMEFVNLIRDGVLLCRMLNKLQPGSISSEEMVLRPQRSQVLCVRNISTFLVCCNKKFNISADDSFEPYMLFDYANVGQVICMLSKLSRCEISVATRIEGFPKDDLKKKEISDIYKSFDEKYITESNLYDKFSIYETKSVKDEIYDDICQTYNMYSSTTLPCQRKTPMADVTSELYDTEAAFVETLQILENIFKKDLKHVMSPQDFGLVFNHVGELYNLHQNLLSHLRDYFVGIIDMSEVFMLFKVPLLIYADYCCNLPHAQAKVLDLLETSHRFKQVLEPLQRKVKGAFTLHDILCVPVARFLKYPMMVQKMITMLDPRDPNYQELNDVEFMLKDLAEYCNEVKRDKENMEQTVKIEECIKDAELKFPQHLTAYGRLVKEGSVLCTAPNEREKKVHLLLFEINLLICENERGSDTTLVYKMGLLLSSTDIDNSEHKRRKKNSFILKDSRDQKKDMSLVITVQTADQKENWISLITSTKRKIVPENYAAGNHQFRLNTFADVTYCQICGSLFRGLIHQGYKCVNRGCGEYAHVECINLCQPCGYRSQPVQSPSKPLPLPPITPQGFNRENFPDPKPNVILVKRMSHQMPNFKSFNDQLNDSPERSPNVGNNGFQDTSTLPAPSPSQFHKLRQVNESTIVMSEPTADHVYNFIKDEHSENRSNDSHNINRLPHKNVEGFQKPEKWPPKLNNQFGHSRDADDSLSQTLTSVPEPNRSTTSSPAKPYRNATQHDLTPRPEPHFSAVAADVDAVRRPKPAIMPKPSLDQSGSFKAAIQDALQKMRDKKLKETKQVGVPAPHPITKQDNGRSGASGSSQLWRQEQGLRSIPASQMTPNVPNTSSSTSSYQRMSSGYDTFTARSSKPPEETIPIYEPLSFSVVSDGTPGWVGRQDRNTASRLLESSANGTFIIRERDDGGYAISIQFYGAIRHIKMYVLENGQVCLAAVRSFNNIQDLLSFYRNNSLREIYDNLDICLLHPYK